MTPDSAEYGTLNAEYIDNREIDRIRDYHNYLFINEGRVSKVVSSAFIQLNYLE